MLLADTDADTLQKLFTAIGYGGAGTLLIGAGVLLRHLYGVWYKYRNDNLVFDEKAFELDQKKKQAALALSIQEEESIENQLQRIISSQSKFITELQQKRDERVKALETKMDVLQLAHNKCERDHATAMERARYLEDYIAQEKVERKKTEKQHEDEIRRIAQKYYELKRNKKSDDTGSDPIVPNRIQDSDTLMTPDDKG